MAVSQGILRQLAAEPETQVPSPKWLLQRAPPGTGEHAFDRRNVRLLRLLGLPTISSEGHVQGFHLFTENKKTHSSRPKPMLLRAAIAPRASWRLCSKCPASCLGPGVVFFHVLSMR